MNILMKNNATRMMAVGLLWCSWCLVGFTWGDPLARNVKKGNQLFRAGQYEQALQAFTEADVNSHAGDQRLPQLYKNIGNTLTKLGKFTEAAAMYKKADDASQNAAFKADARYNSGNAWMKQQQYQQAVEAYKQALDLNPNHREARQNKELAEKLLVQQQEQHKQQQNNQNNEQQKKEQQQQQSSQNQQHQPQNNQQQQDKPKEEQDKQQQKPEEQQTAQAQESPKGEERQLPKEEALRILDALKEKEQSQQQQHQVAPRPVEKDW